MTFWMLQRAPVRHDVTTCRNIKSGFEPMSYRAVMTEGILHMVTSTLVRLVAGAEQWPAACQRLRP